MAKTLEQRFLEKVSPCPLTGCWWWTGGSFSNGYGMFWVNDLNRVTQAHRVAYSLRHGSIAAGAFVCHRCDNPPCVNPDHLFIGTAADNMRDKARKGRGNAPKGERHGRRKLAASQAEEILRRCNSGERPAALAAEFGVSRHTVELIASRKNWRHLNVGGEAGLKQTCSHPTRPPPDLVEQIRRP